MPNRLLACLLLIHVTAGISASPPDVNAFVSDDMTRKQIQGSRSW